MSSSFIPRGRVVTPEPHPPTAWPGTEPRIGLPFGHRGVGNDGFAGAPPRPWAPAAAPPCGGAASCAAAPAVTVRAIASATGADFVNTRIVDRIRIEESSLSPIP